MQQKRLDGLRVACIVTDGFERSELTGLTQAFLQAGAEVKIIRWGSPRRSGTRGEAEPNGEALRRGKRPSWRWR